MCQQTLILVWTGTLILILILIRVLPLTLTVILLSSLPVQSQASKTLGRAIALSNDGGLSFGPVQYDRALISPVCQASITTFGNVTYFSNPASTSSRSRTTIRRSTDDAQTWGSSLLIEPGTSAGYSCLVEGELQGLPGKGGILYEAPGNAIKFAHFPLEF